MTDERQVSIYALCDPDTEDIRYIGQSVDVSGRVKAHIGGSFTGTTKRDKWIRSLLINGKHPALQVLSIVPVSEADQAEMSAIKQAKDSGCKLVNGHNSPSGGISKTKSMSPRPEKYEITFKVGRRTIESIERLAEHHGGKNMLLMILVDRYLR